MREETDTQQGQEFIQYLADYSNCMGRTNEVLVRDMVETLHRQHRTLQQGVVRFLVDLLVEYGKTPDNRTDLRNQDAIQVCRDITENIPRYMRYI